MANNPGVDIAGNHFGRLIAIERSHQNKQMNWIWRCVCRCGNEKLASAANLRRGIVQSCGCLAKENGPLMARRFRQLPPGVAARNALYSGYRCDALDRGYEFALTIEEFSDLTSASCFYCSNTPSYIQKASSGDYIYNGVDRVDNTKGYTIDNCVPCCKICNGAKSSLSRTDFYKWIGKVYATHKDDINKTTIPESFQ